MKSIKSEVNSSQFYVLVRHFVLRLFKNDILKYENQRLERVVVVLAILSIAGGYITHKLISPYLYPGLSGVTAAAIWVKKTVFLTLTMALTGIITVFSWENIFPDRKDYMNLLVLPVKMRTLFAAKFFSLLVFVGLISIAFNIFSLFMFTFYLAPFKKVNLFYFGFSHFITNFLANLFVFLAAACIKSIFTILLKNRLLAKFSNIIQAALLVGFIWVIVWLPQIHSQLPAAKEKLSSFFYYFPPLWFTGIYEKMIGSSDVVFIPHILIAVTAIIITTALYLVSFPISFKRFLSSGKDSGRKKSVLVQRLIGFARRFFDSIFLKHSIQRGMFYFVCQALKRSRKHQLQLVTYMALPFAYIIADLVYFHSRTGWSSFRVPNFFLVGASLIFYFFLAAGLRMIVRHPIMLSANWIFQLTERNEKKHYMKGIKKAFLFLLGFPLFIGLFIFYLYCWGFQLAVFHSFYSAAIFLWLLEMFFNTYKKIPFAGEFEPGKPNIKIYWPLILGGFLEWYVLLSNIGLILLNWPKYYILFFLVIFVLHWGFVFRRYREYKNEDFGFIYDEEPRELMLSLNITK
ncbi:MAG: hypothetical protein JSV88_30875 [Candidatus Aminicenantes bacterium]|nr:MAG: hypothetical protein JSV88_30875 [Candidatus Aminicenantes bacterium]